MSSRGKKIVLWVFGILLGIPLLLVLCFPDHIDARNRQKVRKLRSAATPNPRLTI